MMMYAESNIQPAPHAFSHIRAIRHCKNRESRWEHFPHTDTPHVWKDVGFENRRRSIWGLDICVNHLASCTDQNYCGRFDLMESCSSLGLVSCHNKVQLILCCFFISKVVCRHYSASLGCLLFFFMNPHFFVRINQAELLVVVTKMYSDRINIPVRV